ncbi:TonB-dependent receptor [Gaoshiqia sediminis]|uniref:TonB-dependent receptor n=1 Tax=Gaoshiqia sediminis TaxID=2986998 RepID=A0AA41Y1Q4_9BACT|nr:TonB-dependent receptor [Gaoshiqia sediminis]MCW0481859.1 TonB-dependent receptor [Gaoshiqia sediminis]
MKFQVWHQPHLKQTFRIMKLTSLILFLAFFQVSAGVFSQNNAKVQIKASNKSLVDVLKFIEDETDYSFLFNRANVDVDQKVNVDLEFSDIEEGLKVLLEGTNILYRSFNNNFVLYTNESDHINPIRQQSEPVKGKVSSSSGEPIPGATVVLKGSSIGTVTDVNGNYTLSNVPADATLVFTFVGMRTQEIFVDNRQIVDIQLQEDMVGIDEVVVVGYGIQKKANLTGSVGTVAGNILTERPATNSGNLLQGRISGLQVIQPSAEPGRDNPSFLIRGRGSFGGSNDPLILIDGVTGSLNNLSPDDIENITLLKDAASASIYGARAANGVILVTTKKGEKGKTVVSYRGNIAVNSPTKLPDFITNSAEYMEMYNKAAARSGIAFRYAEDEIAKYRNATDREQYPNFDAVDYWFKNAIVTNHSISLSGGSEKSAYNASFSYLDQEAMLPGYKFKRYNALLSYTNEISKILDFGTKMILTYKDRQEPPFTSANMALSIYATGPTYGPYLPDGSGRIASRAYLNEGRNRNPSEYYAMGNQKTKDYNLNAQAYIDLKPFKGFVWTTKVAINYDDSFYKMHQVPYKGYVLQEKDTNTGDNLEFAYGPDILGVTDQYSKAITPTVYSVMSYNTTINNDHDISALLGYEQISYKYQTLRARRINSVSPILDELTGYSSDNQSLFFTHPRLPSLAGPSEWAMQSIFGRANYSFKGKYLVEANLRYDGTSKVSPDYRWGLFPSASAGWLMSEESFIKDQVSWINYLKLRASYGVLGNQDVGTYLYQNNLVINNVYYPFEESLSQGAVVNVFKDQSLKWESTSILDFGFDVNIFSGLLGVTFDWFNKTTYDILAAQPVPASLGLSSPTLNDGKMRNKGIELELSHQNKIGEVNYGANFQISTAKNELVHIRVPSKGTTINEVGLPYGSHFLYIWDGIFQEDDIDNPLTPKHVLNPNPRPGDLKMKDMDGDGDVDTDDRRVVGGAYADFLYSFGLNIGYKNFTLSAFFQGVEGRKARVNNWGIDPFMQGTPPTTKWRDAWTPENQSNTLPAIYVAGYSGVANFGGSTYYLQDASYLRLKNVMLSYDLPKSLISKIRAKDLSVYVSADNLLTFTKYEGSDPERASVTGNYAEYPQARIFNFGLNVKF